MTVKWQHTIISWKGGFHLILWLCLVRRRFGDCSLNIRLSRYAVQGVKESRLCDSVNKLVNVFVRCTDDLLITAVQVRHQVFRRWWQLVGEASTPTQTTTKPTMSFHQNKQAKTMALTGRHWSSSYLTKWFAKLTHLCYHLANANKQYLPTSLNNAIFLYFYILLPISQCKTWTITSFRLFLVIIVYPSKNAQKLNNHNCTTACHMLTSFLLWHLVQ